MNSLQCERASLVLSFHDDRMKTSSFVLRDGRTAAEPFACRAAICEKSPGVNAAIIAAAAAVSVGTAFLIALYLRTNLDAGALDDEAARRVAASAVAAMLLFFPFAVALISYGLNAARLRAASHTRDLLTGLFNRDGFTEAANAILKNCRGREPEEPVGLFVIGIDEMVRLQDEFGAEGANRVVSAVADALRSAIRTEDPVGYLRSGEFSAVLTGVGADTGSYIGDRLRRAVSGIDIRPGGRRFDLTVSVGATVMNGRLGFDSVYRDAGFRLDEARGAGQNCVMAGRFGKPSEVWPESLPARLQAVEPGKQRRGPGREAERDAELQFWREEDRRRSAPSFDKEAAE